ncbi:MAG: carboxymuconolactone decarboxylase family protein [Planctomycetota bacterium]|jgi:alkylhydroperoxidase/carboxymuconolactone decarboxylase family protein YurZ
MSTDATTHYANWPAQIAAMRDAAPDITRGFGGMFQKLMGEGALSVREKELIALAIDVEKAVQAGATREQILEMAGVVVTMQGGPGYTYVPKLLEALEALGVAEVA